MPSSPACRSTAATSWSWLPGRGYGPSNWWTGPAAWLDDGREYRIVKRFRTATNLEDRWRRAALDETETYFQFGVGTPR